MSFDIYILLFDMVYFSVEFSNGVRDIKHTQGRVEGWGYGRSLGATIIGELWSV